MFKKLILNSLLLILFISSCSQPVEITSIENPSGDQSSLPRLFTDNTGLVFMSWVEHEEDNAKLYYAIFENGTWSKASLIQESNEWFVNWADFPSIIARNGSPMASHWLKKIPGNTYSYNVEVATFKENQFNEAVVPHTDGTATEHGFVSMTPISDSTFYAIWLDGRNTSGGHTGHSDLSTAMTLRGALMDISGETLLEEELDANICDCCNTSLATTSNGLIAAYRNRTENEIRDIYIKKMVDGIWDEEQAVFDDGWQIAACPVNGPAIDVYNNTASVAWFSGANNEIMVKLAFSTDEGDSFLEPILVDSLSTLGRVDVLANDENSSWVSWISRSNETALLHLQLISIDGEVLQSHIVSEMNPSRSSGFPQITKTNTGLLIAWTDVSDDGKSIKTKLIQ